MSYGVGYIDADTGVAVDIQLPQGMHSYRGPIVGQQLVGCKGKKDYNGDFWFFATDNQINPGTMWLCRAKRLPTGLIQLDYAEIPDYDEGVAIKPTQLTVDKHGNVYFNSGTMRGDTWNWYKATVTSATPFTVDFLVVENENSGWEMYGVTLNKSHTFVSCVVIVYLDEEPTGAVIETTDCATLANPGGYALATIPTVLPCNIETDVSDGNNDDRSVTYYETAADGVIVSYYVDPLSGDASDQVVTNVATLTYNRSVCVRPDGVLFTLVRHNYCNAAPNRQILYVPQADNTYANETNNSIVCAAINNNPTHMDIQRSIPQRRMWAASGDIGNGPIGSANLGGSYVQRFLRPGYSTYCTGTDREAYT